MYNAIITPLMNVRKHPNADRLNLATAAGNQVIVGLENVEGQLGIYFPTDGQLARKFAEVNDLLRRKDANGKPAGGMFDENCRIRAQKFRGERSEGFWLPIEALTKVGVKQLPTAGTEFTTLDGVEICRKFETRATQQARTQTKQTRGSTVMFARHFETEQLRHHIKEIPDGAHVILTEKLHGTSHRIGRVMEPRVLGRTERVLNWIEERLGFEPRTEDWTYLHGTRNVVMDNLMTDTYYTTGFRGTATQVFQDSLHKGEVVYCEIVGWDGDKPIMPRHNVQKLKDAEMLQKYGKQITYQYGQAVGTAKAYVYRITQVNEDGDVVELSWNQVVARCKELNVPTVPMLSEFIYQRHADIIGPEQGDENLLSLVQEYAEEGTSTLDPTQIKEGVCVRVESPTYQSILKLKNFDFLQMEANSKDDDVVDTEEAS